MKRTVITVFAIGMIIGAPVIRWSHRAVEAADVGTGDARLQFGHVVVAVSTDLSVLLAARFVTAAMATVLVPELGGSSAGRQRRRRTPTA